MNLPALRSLQLHNWEGGCKWDPAMVLPTMAAFMAAAPQLQRVDAHLARCPGRCLTGVLCRGLPHFNPGVTSLQLNIRGDWQWQAQQQQQEAEPAPAEAHHISASTTLHHLWLATSAMTPADIACLSALTRLRSLHVSERLWYKTCDFARPLLACDPSAIQFWGVGGTPRRITADHQQYSASAWCSSPHRL